MKSLVLTGIHMLEYKESDHPGKPGPEEVLIQIDYTGICGSDLSNYKKGAGAPVIRGHEISGIIVEKGKNVESFQVGDTVTVNPLYPCMMCRNCRSGQPQRCMQLVIRNHGFAEYIVVPTYNCYRVNDSRIGALAEPLACSIRAAEQAKITLGDTVVIFGAGMIGLFAMKAAEWMGATRRILVDTNEHRLMHGKAWGATDVLNPLVTDPLTHIREITNDSVQRVIDAVGLVQTRQNGIELIEKGGRVVWIGLHADETSFSGKAAVVKEVEVVGSFCYTHHNFMQSIICLESQRIQPDRSWLDVRPLAEGKAAFDEQLEGAAVYPKIMLTPRHELIR
jgi:threonine dehydrogenase-like Zn-dependent dehydrogenase